MLGWKKFLLIIIFTLVGIVLIASIVAYVYEDEIKSIVVSNINKNLNTPVEVREISFSIIRKFPFATLEFDDVKAQGLLYKETKKDLVVAEKIFLMFNLWDVFNDNIALKKVEVKNAIVNLYINPKGLNNYEVWKTENRDSASTFNLDIEKVQLSNVRMNYINKVQFQDFAITIPKGDLSGHFASESFELSTKADLLVHHFIADDINYLNKKNVTVDYKLEVNTRQHIYTFNNASLKIADLVLKAEGTVNTLKQTAVNLKVSADKANLKELISLIPQQYLKDVDRYKYTGSVYFDAVIKGVMDRKNTPLVELSFGTTDATLSPANSDYKITALRFKGKYANRKSGRVPVDQLSLTEMSGNLEGQPFKGSLQVENFENPLVNFSAHSKINLESLSHFYQPDTIQSMSGVLVVDATFSGRADDKSTYNSSGTMEMQKVNFQLKNKDIDFNNFNGHFTLSGNQLMVNDFNGQAAGSDFKLNGNFNNIFSFLMLPDQTLSCTAELSSRNIDLNELLENKAKTTSKDTAYRLDFSDKLNLKLRLNIGIITFQKFEAWQMRGGVTLANKILTTENLSFKAVDGSVLLQGSINTSKTDSMLISYNAEIKSLDINQLFYQMGNFGQAVLTDKNLKGNVSASVQFASVWSKSLNCNMDKVYAKADVTIENGELNNFSPMLALSRYLKGADLKQIKFSTLHNTVEINKQRIIIPTMQINSNAFELTASGSHSFDNIVDYRLAFLLSQILGKKVKEQNTEFGTIEDDGLGRGKLFITMKGKASDPKISFDKRAVEQKITTDIKTEKANLKNVLNKEFGWFKKDSSAKAKPPKTKKAEELQIEREE